MSSSGIRGQVRKYIHTYRKQEVFEVVVFGCF